MTRDEQRRCKRELAELWPRALRRAAAERDSPVSLKGQSPVGRQFAPYMRVENVVGVFIYARFGGWYSDVMFDPAKLPPAAPTAFGTPMHLPHKTRDEAEENAVTLLAMLIHTSRAPPPPPPQDTGERHFSFFGLWLVLPAELFKLMDAIVAATGFDPADKPQDWLDRLDTLKREAFGDGAVTAAAFDALPLETRRKIWTLCAVVWSRLGLLRYPNEPAGPP